MSVLVKVAKVVKSPAIKPDLASTLCVFLFMIHHFISHNLCGVCNQIFGPQFRELQKTIRKLKLKLFSSENLSRISQWTP